MTRRIHGDTFTDEDREIIRSGYDDEYRVYVARRAIDSIAALRAEVERLTKDAESLKRLAAPDDGQPLNRHGWRGRAAALRRERDEARAALAAMAAERDEAKRALDHIEALLPDPPAASGNEPIAERVISLRSRAELAERERDRGCDHELS